LPLGSGAKFCPMIAIFGRVTTGVTITVDSTPQMAKRRRDRWALGPAFSIPEAARGGPEVDLPVPDPVLAWLQFPDRILEVEARVIAWTDRAVLVE
jgi:hypothetical protein